MLRDFSIGTVLLLTYNTRRATISYETARPSRVENSYHIHERREDVVNIIKELQRRRKGDPGVLAVSLIRKHFVYEKDSKGRVAVAAEIF